MSIHVLHSMMFKKGDMFKSTRTTGDGGIDYTLVVVNKVLFSKNLFTVRIATRVTNPDFYSHGNYKIVNGNAIAEWIRHEIDNGYSVKHFPADRLISININDKNIINSETNFAQ